MTPENAEAIEREYAARSGMTLETLRDLGLRAVTCDCDAPNCRGWRIEFAPDALSRQRSVLTSSVLIPDPRYTGGTR